MKYDKIKIELESEIESLLQLSENKTRQASGIDKLKASADHFEKADSFSQTVIDKLNEVLQRHKIKFIDDSEKNEFMSFIQPTITESLTKFLRN